MSQNFKKYLNMYEWETTLPGSGKVLKYKPIVTGQIKSLLMFSESDDDNAIENALDKLIQECVTTEGFNVKDLYLPDRFYLMVEIRNATKGSKYTFQSRCYSCNSQSMQTVDLSKLPLKKLEIDKTELEVKEYVKNEKSVQKKGVLEIVNEKQENIDDIKNDKKISDVINTEKLPWNYVKINDNVSVILKLMTRQMQFEIGEYIKGKDLDDEQKDIETNLLTYAMAIESIITPAGVEMDLTLEDKLYFIENITPPEKELIGSWFNKNDFGLNFKFNAKCIHCGNEVEREIPLQDFFY